MSRYSTQVGCIPGEVKHLSSRRKINRIDSVSSGERKRNSLNPMLRKERSGVAGVVYLNMIKPIFVGFIMNGKKVTKLIASRTALERPTTAGDSPVSESDQPFTLFPKYPWSRLSVVNPGLLRSKAKYF